RELADRVEEVAREDAVHLDALAEREQAARALDGLAEGAPGDDGLVVRLGGAALDRHLEPGDAHAGEPARADLRGGGARVGEGGGRLVPDGARVGDEIAEVAPHGRLAALEHDAAGAAREVLREVAAEDLARHVLERAAQVLGVVPAGRAVAATVVADVGDVEL